MSKRSDPAAFARAAGAADPVTPADPAPAPDIAPPPGPPFEPVPPFESLPGPSPESATALAVTQDEDAPPQPRNPADYRWVPVCRVPRYDGWTEEKQRRFIETLADTGLVNVACKAVGMSRESAYRLRRSAHGVAFGRAWDAARQHAAGLIEDIAFERAIEGTEREVLSPHGEVIATRLVHDNRLLQYLLRHLRPERYGRARAPTADPAPDAAGPPDMPTLQETLRAMEPVLPAPPETLLDPETLDHELELADLADGKLPQFLAEQRPPKSAEQLAADEAAARDARGAAALEKSEAGGKLTDEEFADQCYHLDPYENRHPRPRRRQGRG